MFIRSKTSAPSLPQHVRNTLFAALLGLAACSPAPEVAAPAAVSAAAAASPAAWPRTIDTPRGPLTLTQPPTRIVSTSVTLTGTLLTIEAPVIGSGATSANSAVADGQGFFRQWSEVARTRGVQSLYQGEADAEAIAAADPDLVVVAGTGGDSA